MRKLFVSLKVFFLISFSINKQKKVGSGISLHRQGSFSHTWEIIILGGSVSGKSAMVTYFLKRIMINRVD